MPSDLCMQTVQYDRRVLYDVFDVTSMLTSDKINSVGIALGKTVICTVPLHAHILSTGTWWYSTNSSYFFNPPFQLPFGERVFGLLINITYSDGSTDTVTSTTDWKQFHGKVVSDDMFIGEQQDGRLAQPSWEEPSFNGECVEPIFFLHRV